MKYFIGFLLSIGLIVGVFLLVLNGFKSTSKPKAPTTALVSYADTSRQMQMTVVGPITADQTHDEIRITVGRSNTTMQIIQGYNGQVLKSQTYDNNEASYAEFLRALDLSGYTRGVKNTDFEDDRGFCASGKRYSFDILDGSDVKQHYWTTTCSGRGNFKGNRSQIESLFQRQVPDYNTMIQGVAF
jgi:hypothetical protein